MIETADKTSRISTFEDLEVWQMGRDLVVRLYGVTAAFPKEDLYGLTSQIRRAALSVPSNVAEGFGRYHYMDRVKFFLNARGSLYELKSHLLIAGDLGYIGEEKSREVFGVMERLAVKLNNLIEGTRKLSGVKSTSVNKAP